MFHGFSIDLSKLREKYCHFVKPYVIREEEELNQIFSSFYQHNRTLPEIAKAKEYYMIKVVELLLYLNVLCVENIKANKPYYCIYKVLDLYIKDQAELSVMIHWCLYAMLFYIIKIITFSASTWISHIAAYHILEGMSK